MDETEQLLREDAERQGLTFSEYCNRYGIVGPSQERKIRRHEIPLEGNG